jgi:hypothetical protein
MGLFDRQSMTFLPATRDSYMNNTVTPDNTATPGYAPYQRGALSLLGQALTGVSAAFSGDSQWLQRQQKIDQEQYQADLEFKAKLMQQRMTMQENQSQKALRDAQTKVLDAQAKYFDSQSNGGSLAGGIDYPYPEDIQMTPKTTVYKGIPKTTLVPELKKEVSQNELTTLGGISSTVSDLQKNIDTLNKYNITPGPGLSTSGLPGADLYSQFTKSKEFNTWKADTGRTFQKYRKWATGVAAGYPELQLLAPTFPKASDTKENFISKSVSAMDDMNRNKEIVLDYLNKAGYRTGELRGVPATSNTVSSISKNDPRYQSALKWYKPEEIDAYFKGKK